MTYLIIILLIILIFGSCIVIKYNWKWYYNLLLKLWYKIKLFLTWRIILCFGIAWMITNGWCYVFIILGSTLHISWMRNIGLGYAAFLYFPFTVEKPVTFAIAIFLHKKIFPKHSTAVLENRLNQEIKKSKPHLSDRKLKNG